MTGVVARPDNPGTYMSLVGESTVRPPSSIAQVVAIPIIHDWGPLGSDPEGMVRLSNFGEFEAIFGNSPSAGRDAVLGAFVGPGVPDKAAAGEVLVYRMSKEAIKASLKLKNTAGSPEDALTLTALYAGARGNRISVKTENDPVTVANDRLSILFDGVVVERYSYPETNITQAAELINARSKFVTAAKLVTGKTLGTVSATSLASGASGESLTATQWTQALSALEFEDFSILAPYDLTTSEIVTSVYAWTQTQAEMQRPVTTVLGGAKSEELASAITAVGSIRDPHVVRLAGGAFYDDFLAKEVSTSQLAPRIAGVLAGCGEEASLTFMPLAGLHQVGTVTISAAELKTAADEGLTVFRRTSRPDADLIVGKGVTTFNSKTDATRPYELFSDPRIVRVADLFLRRMKEWGDTNIVGPTRVTDTTKAAVRQQGTAEINALLERGLIQAGKASDGTASFFRISDNPGAGLDDAIVFDFGWKFVRTTNFLIGSGRVK